MPIRHRRERKTADQLAFAHYLRTGERLTSQEWLHRDERKFNPYHDEIGRFTTPPGVTVSYGKRGGEEDRRPSARRQRSVEPRNAHNSRHTVRNNRGGDARRNTNRLPENPIEKEIQSTWSSASPISSRFDLNQRQAHLDRLRREAGSNASAIQKAAFDETQRRLDDGRRRLAEGDRIADRELLNAARMVVPPLDTGASFVSIVSGEGDWGDALNVASSVPLVGSAGKIGKLLLPGRLAADAAAPIAKTIQLGGPHWKVRRLKPEGYQPHHIPPDSVNGLRYGEGPTIAMRAEHHKRTASHSAMPGSKRYLAKQRELIEQGKFREAVEMDIQDIRNVFGDTYDDAIQQMLDYIAKKGY